MADSLLNFWYCRDWIKQSLDLWNSNPNCQFWDIQWAGIFARCIKNYNSIDWECFLPALFTHYLNMFEVSTMTAGPFRLMLVLCCQLLGHGGENPYSGDTSLMHLASVWIWFLLQHITSKTCPCFYCKKYHYLERVNHTMYITAMPMPSSYKCQKFKS